jgi:hypothetical protein
MSCCIASNFRSDPGLLRFLQSIGTCVEYQSVSLPQSRLRLRPRAGGHRGAQGRTREFLLHLNDLHYPYTDETANAAYRMFLAV